MCKQIRKSLGPQDRFVGIFRLALRFMVKIGNQTDLLLALLQSPSLTVGRLISLSVFPCSHVYRLHVCCQKRSTEPINDSKVSNPISTEVSQVTQHCFHETAVIKIATGRGEGGSRPRAAAHGRIPQRLGRAMVLCSLCHSCPARFEVSLPNSALTTARQDSRQQRYLLSWDLLLMLLCVTPCLGLW